MPTTAYTPLCREEDLLSDLTGHLQCVSTAALVASLAPDVSVVRLIRSTLASRGLNAEGAWVGFQEAVRLFEADFGFPSAPAALAPTAEPLGPRCDIETRRFELSHGRAPRGRGSWLFETRDGRLACQFNGLYADARRAAKAYGRSKGHDVLFTCP